MSELHQLAHETTIALRGRHVGIGGTVQATYPLSLRYHAETMTTDETNATATNATSPQPGSATGETIVASVADAATLLGVTPQAIRKQIAAGRLNATKHRGAWRIFLEQATIATSATATDETPPQPRNATAQLAPHEEQAKQMAVFADAITAPLRQRIEELNRELGHVEEQLEMVTNERDELRAAQESALAAQAALGASEDVQTGDQTSAGESGQESRLRNWWEWIKRH
jgi:septal ring factor EnvC (AmiA/AmiB activator)